jgi:TM2 domain-containing membrane protein YozV
LIQSFPMLNPTHLNIRSPLSVGNTTRKVDRKVAAVLAFVGAVPMPIFHGTISGLHKFYLGQPRWGVLYLLLCFTPIPAIASVLEGLWYLFQDGAEFDRLFNMSAMARQTEAIATQQQDVANLSKGIADAVRDLDQLRQEGLISEYEFEQKRRQILDKI